MTTEKVNGTEAVYYLVNMYYVRKVTKNGVAEVTDNVEKNRVYARWAIDKAMRCAEYAKRRLEGK